MGKQFSEANALQKQLTYPIRQAADGTIEVVCENEERGLSPEQVSAEILKVKNLANRQSLTSGL